MKTGILVGSLGQQSFQRRDQNLLRSISENLRRVDSDKYETLNLFAKE